MTITSKLHRAFMAVIASLFISVSAFAQSTILVVDQGRVMTESEVGKHIERQLKSIASTMKSELKAQSPSESEASGLLAEIKSYESNPEGLKSRTDLQSRWKDLQLKSQKQQVEAAYKQRELQVTEAKAFQKVQENLTNILKTIVAERNADVVLDRSLVIYGQPADITDDVISRLNSQMRTVPVSRERLPRK